MSKKRGTKAAVIPPPPRHREVVPAVPRRLRDAGAAALLVCTILLAYRPALNGGPIIDDLGHLTGRELQSLGGLWRIWFELGAVPQYYPLLHSAFWVEHRLWGDAVLGYHLTNVLLHALAALLVVALVRRLSLPGAWLAGFLFALHPVCVEAVAWMSEQKSTLSAVFYLGAALAYLHFDRTRRKSLYWLALGLFALALLSKTVTATLPAALLVVLWWQRGRLHWRRDVLPLLPWLAGGAAAGLFTAWVERKFIGAAGPEYALTLVQRCLIAGRALWFYLGKLVWPANLTFVYPRWTVDAAVWWQYAFPVGALAAGLALFLLARFRRGPLAAFLFFAGTLFPALGFFNVYPFVYSYVADHYQYLASLGVIVPISAGLAMLVGRMPARARRIVPLLGGMLLVMLGGLAWRQSGTYRDAETLYASILARNPACWLAENNLGKLYLDTPGRVQEAIPHLEAALRLKPDNFMPHYNLGAAFTKIPGRLPEALAEYEAALRIKPDLADAHDGLAKALLSAGRPAEAIAEFRAALRLMPGVAAAHNNLGTALAMTGSLQEAIAEFQAALRLDPDFDLARFNLEKALAHASR